MMKDGKIAIVLNDYKIDDDVDNHYEHEIVFEYNSSIFAWFCIISNSTIRCCCFCLFSFFWHSTSALARNSHEKKSKENPISVSIFNENYLTDTESCKAHSFRISSKKAENSLRKWDWKKNCSKLMWKGYLMNGSSVGGNDSEMTYISCGVSTLS